MCQLVPPDVPMILESRVDESEINEEIRSAIAALNPAGQLAVAGDGVRKWKGFGGRDGLKAGV